METSGGGGGGGTNVVESFGSFGVCSPMGSSNMRQSFNLDYNCSNIKRIGVPPSHPKNNHHIFMASRSNSQSLDRLGSSHSRSLSQSAVFSLDCLPPLSPLPSLSSGSNQSDPVLTDVSMEDKGLLVPPPAMVADSGLKTTNDGLPPRRGHRRSMSDSVPLAFSTIIQSSPQLIPIGKNSQTDEQSLSVKHELDANSNNAQVKSQGGVVDDLLSAYMHLENIDTLHSSGTEDKDLDSRVSGTKTNGTESSDNEVESRVKDGLKRSAGGDIAGASRHCRSESMDSYIGSLNFDDESLKFPGIVLQDHQSPGSSIDGKLARFNLEFRTSEFTEAELKKIIANEKLTEIAMADPKRVKRILANRLSAARSKERKTRYISELEQKVQTLQTEATTLSAQVTVLQRDSAALQSQNNELKFCLQAMEQQAKLKDALNEALIAEVQRLRVAAVELQGNMHQQLPIINQQMLKLQLHQPTHLGTYQTQDDRQNQPQPPPQHNGDSESKLK